MDTSFSSSSTGSHSALHQDALRVNRFLSRNEKKKQHLTSASSPSFRPSSPLFGLNALSACNSGETLHNIVALDEKVQQKTYVIEGIHGPVTTEKAPIGAISKKRDHQRSRQRFKQYVAAKQSERAKKFSVDLLHMPLPSEEYSTYYSRQTNDSPTTVAADISVIENICQIEQDADDAFICMDRSPLKSNFNRHVGMIPKKKLTWWDDDENRHKPFLLRSDDLYDDYDDESSCRDNVLFGRSICPHDNLKDLIEDYSDRLRSTVVDLFQVKRRIENNAMFRDNFASFSDDIVDEEEHRGCAGPSRQLMKVVANILPPVCEFETRDSS